MGSNTSIAWADHTFNIAWGCVKISPGCARCYAERIASDAGHDVWGVGASRRTFGVKYWQQPCRWHRIAASNPRRVRVFTSSMCDVCEDNPTIERERDRLWRLIDATPALDWLVLTKRPERLPVCLPRSWGNGWSNVWLGVSVESMAYTTRIERLTRIPAVVRFVSYEPALGPLDGVNLTGIDWLIYGGESGPDYRMHKLEWARAMRDKCRAEGVAFFYKQSSAYRTEMGTTLDGETIKEFPTPRPGDAGRLF